jgi:hypothetical protein
MQNNEDPADDVPVADAVEQQQPASKPLVEDEAAVEPPQDPPMEVSAADWQEQLETVELDPEDDVVEEDVVDDR